ncbi:hypothetical protein A6E04_08280 [Aliivibrio logei]|uniref:Uncharacterized protein n=1 Tax=Aliivibrio logei TaxID=688 RepID=A0A1B9P0G1_ALILO|nr:hypothetical protein A6E04_08280 [Aliivibrio logei]
MNVIKRSELLVRLQIILLRIINIPVTVCVKVNQLYALGRNDKNEVGVKTEIKVEVNPLY